MNTDLFGHIRNEQSKRILSAFGVKNVTEPDIQEVEKGDTELEPFNVYEDDDNVEKSDILYAISNCDNPVTMKKTGKEIKEQITNVVLPEKRVALENKKKEADALLTECGNAPTHSVPPYYTGGIKTDDIPFKIYNWDETYFRASDPSSPSIISSLSVYDQEDKVAKLKGNPAENAEQAAARSKYNDEVNKYCEILTDIKACEILLKNLKDGDSIDLTARQIMAFKFD